ncbi:hypothetical protein V6O07_07630, partial [Arthrospira platensis SPKY2]
AAHLSTDAADLRCRSSGSHTAPAIDIYTLLCAVLHTTKAWVNIVILFFSSQYFESNFYSVKPSLLCSLGAVESTVINPLMRSAKIACTAW